MKLMYVGKKKETEGIWTFYFLPPENTTWKAGQSIRLELPRNTWGVDERRFTIASIPSEKHIQITTNVSNSTFKTALNELKKGDEINGYNIEGSFTWQTGTSHKLLIAGGVGITPYRALIKSQIESGNKCNATLIYSAKNHIFEKEFDNWTRADHTLRIILLERRLALGNNTTLLQNWLKSRVYISGPEEMVRDLYKQFVDHKVPKSHIKTDIFTGL